MSFAALATATRPSTNLVRSGRIGSSTSTISTESEPLSRTIASVKLSALSAISFVIRPPAFSVSSRIAPHPLWAMSSSNGSRAEPERPNTRIETSDCSVWSFMLPMAVASLMNV
jgi:hypothetical protein